LPRDPKRPSSTIEVVNRQRHRKIEAKIWEGFAARALLAIRTDLQHATVAFISSRQIRQLNKRYRGIDSATDVLSFPAGDDPFASGGANLGDIAIAVDYAEQQARDHGLKFDQEIAQLILHGLLHLNGYDHETDSGEMDKLELRLRKKLGI
jgi:probable rRNA maturation factor